MFEDISIPFVEQRRHNGKLEKTPVYRVACTSVLQRLYFKLLLYFEIPVLLKVLAQIRGTVNRKHSGVCMC